MKCRTVPAVKQERHVEYRGYTALGMTEDKLDDALYNLKLKAVTIVTEVLPWLALIGVLFIAVTVLA